MAASIPESLPTSWLPVPGRAKPTASQRRPSISTGPSHGQTTDKIRNRLWSAVEKTSNLYQYSPIGRNTVRLLTVQPKYVSSQDERKLYVVLTDVAISQLQQELWQYEALSYYWGNQEAGSVIYVANDIHAAHDSASLRDVVHATQRRWREFRIKPNLYEALMHLRHDHVPRRYWIDALCIWQSNKQEKEHQVQMMDKIYSRAARVLIWLGPANDGTRSAMQFVPKLVDLDKVGHFATNGDEGNVQAWMDFLHLMRREWFSRRWVVQELALAQEAVMLCGEDEVNWIDFRDAVSLFARNIDSIQELFKRSRKHERHHNVVDGFEGMGVNKLLRTINNVFRTSRSGEDFEPDPIQGLEYLVSTLFGFHSSDPRDTIHALRNISKEKSRPFGGKSARPPKPDYSKGLLVTYTDFVRWVQKSTGCIDIICRYWAQPERAKEDVDYPQLAKLPSWIQQNPPFESKKNFERRINGDIFVGLPGRGSYDACHGFPARVRYGAYSDLSERSLPLPIEEVKERSKMTPSRAWTPKRQRDCSESGAENNSVKVPRMAPCHAQPDPGRTTPTPGTAADGINTEFQQHDRPEVHVEGSEQVPRIAAALMGRMSGNAETQRNCIEAWQKTIQVEGLLIGRIDWATDPIPDGVIPTKVLETLGHRANSQDWPSDKLWRTLVAERDEHGNNPPPWYSRACHYCLLNGTPNGHINTRDLLRQTQPDDVKDYLKRVQAVTWNRVFLEAKRPVPPPLASPLSDDGNSNSMPSTNVSRVGSPEAGVGARRFSQEGLSEPQGHQSRPPSAQSRLHQNARPRGLTLEVPDGSKVNLLTPAADAVEKLHGLGPSAARKGDIVCILFGCSVPCILRPGDQDALGEYYEFLDEAYIYGLMDGEAVTYRKDEENHVGSQVFEIR